MTRDWEKINLGIISGIEGKIGKRLKDKGERNTSNSNREKEIGKKGKDTNIRGYLSPVPCILYLIFHILLSADLKEEANGW